MSLKNFNSKMFFESRILLKNLLKTRHPNYSLKFPIGNNKELDIPVSNISYIESDGVLSKFHMIDGSRNIIKIANTIGECEKQLAEYAFIRTHRSYLVNCSSINFIESGKACNIILLSKVEIPVSRRRMKAIKTLFVSLGFPCNGDPSI